jgi:hypothetical protein
VLNCVRIGELFILPPAKVTPRLAREAVETMRTAWQTKLKSDFPRRIFDVSVVLDDPPEASEVSFFQPKHIYIPPEE